MAGISQRFLQDGYVNTPADNREALDTIRLRIAELAANHLKIARPNDVDAFLNRFGDHCGPQQLNEVRLAVIAGLTAWPQFHELYFSCGRSALEEIVGNELAIQRSVGFSIQLPNDESSVLPLHSDVWSEDSAFEVVLWIPLVHVFKTKSMFLLPLDRDTGWRKKIATYRDSGVEALYSAVEPELQWLDVPYGNVVVFSHTVMHGNRMNCEDTARWSLNVRFKGLFTPYADKELGDFFQPLTIRPASRIGLTYQLPGGFEEA